MIAQLTPEQIEFINSLVGEWTPLIMAVVPFVLGIALRYDQLANAKRAVSIVVAVAVALATIGQEGGFEDLTVQLVIGRALTAWLTGQLVYNLVDAMVSKIEPLGLNVLLGRFLTLFPFLAKDPERTAVLVSGSVER